MKSIYLAHSLYKVSRQRLGANICDENLVIKTEEVVGTHHPYTMIWITSQ